LGSYRRKKTPKQCTKTRMGRPERVGINADAKKPQNRGVQEQESVDAAEMGYGGACAHRN